MIYGTFTHTMGEEKAKISILDAIIDGKIYYYARVINLEDPMYLKMPESEKENFYGVQVNDVNRDTVIYTDPEKLKRDIIENYGIEGKDGLLTEKVQPNFFG